MNSTLSVIIPTHNRANLIGRAIRSALAQCTTDDEVIVVDDGSTDNTGDIVAEFGDSVRYVRVPNGGAGSARNIGIKMATKNLVAFLDSDDEWFPHKLELQRRLLDAQPNVLYCFSDFGITLHDDRAIHNFLPQWLRDPSSWTDTIGTGQPYTKFAELPASVPDFTVHVRDYSCPLAENLFMLTSSVVVRRVEAGGALHFASDLPIYEDWECFARLSLRGVGAYLDREMAWQHGTAEQRVSQAENLARGRTWLKMSERVWKLDARYWQTNSAKHEELVTRNLRELYRSLIGVGRCSEVRGLIKNFNDVPLHYRVLVHAPDSLLRLLVTARRRLMGKRVAG